MKKTFLLIASLLCYVFVACSSPSSDPQPTAPENCWLTSLSVSGGILSPAFSKDILSYTATVPATQGVITVLYTTGSGVDGTYVDPYSGITLDSGEQKDITVTIYGADNYSQKYTVTIIKAQPVKSSNANLSELVSSVGSLSPAFDPMQTEYSLSVPNGVTSVTLTGTLEDPKASPVSPVTVSDLEVGVAKSAAIAVTAEDGETKKTYTVSVTRVALGTDATLKSLGVSSGTLSPSFNPSQLSYELLVKGNVSSVTLSPVTNDPNATYTITGNLSNLTIGINYLATVTVTSENGLVNRAYTVTVKRQDGNAKATAIVIGCTTDTGTGINFPIDILSSGHIYISVSVNPDSSYSYRIKSVTHASTASASFSFSSFDTSAAWKAGTIDGNSAFEKIVRITAQDGTVNTYTLYLVLSSAIPLGQYSATTHLFDPLVRAN